MQKNKTLIILFLTSATALATANAQMSPAANASGTTGTVAPNSLVNNTTTNTDQILLLSNFPGTNFLILAAADSLLEIQLGLIAQTNSSNPAVQQFGQTLVSDHTKSLQDARNLAGSLGITLRTLDPQNQAILQRFESLSGNEFDRVFARYTIQGHIQDVGRFELAAARAWNWDVRSYAANNLPVLLRHLQMALNIRENLLGNQSLSNP
jgi:putative membrane protein